MVNLTPRYGCVYHKGKKKLTGGVDITIAHQKCYLGIWSTPELATHAYN
jgi:hypothetical protein